MYFRFTANPRSNPAATGYRRTKTAANVRAARSNQSHCPVSDSRRTCSTQTRRASPVAGQNEAGDSRNCVATSPHHARTEASVIPIASANQIHAAARIRRFPRGGAASIGG